MAMDLKTMITACGLVLAPVLALAQQPPASTPAASPAAATERARIKEIVREVLKEHPELVLEAIQELEARERSEANSRAAQALGQHRDQLERAPGDPVGGNPSGDVTLVEFFDYKCPYCKQVNEQLFETVKQDGRVRVVFKELPILGRESLIASHAALASMNQGQGKYVAFHRALLAERGPLDEAGVTRVAASVGLDTGKLKTDMVKTAIDDRIKRNLELAHALDIRGTPAFVIGDELIPGAVDAEALKTAIAKARGH